MIRLFGAFSAFLAICPIGLYCAGSSVASPPSENGHCSFVLDGPKVVNIAGVNYVRATLDSGSCTLNAHTEQTVCLSIEGDPSRETSRPDSADGTAPPVRQPSTSPTGRGRRMSWRARDVRTSCRAPPVRPRPRRFAKTSPPRASHC